MMESSATSTSTSPREQGAPPLLPQYGFGATYTFDALVEQHQFLYRVHTPKRKGNNLSRATSPEPRASSPSGSVRSRRSELHGHGHTHAHGSARSPPPPALSASVSSIRSSESGATDYFGYHHHHSPSHSSYSYSYVEEEEGAAPGDAYFLSRKFKEDLTSPDAGRRRRTISTLSTLSGGSGGYSSYIGSEDGSDLDLESEGSSSSSLLFLTRGGNGPGNLSRSASMMLGHAHSNARVRSDSLSSARPGAKPKRSQSVGMSEATASEHVGMTYSELVRHLDWTTRSSSPYVTTSFSFFFCLWEAVRRYKLGVKHDVEIAVIDARKVQGRARTALEVLRSVEPEKQDKAYWKWYRFALESQDVLVFGAISGDAIYASIPLTQILPKLPSYLFATGAPLKSISDPREPGPSIEREREREQEREALTTSHLLTKLAWDIGTTLKRPKKRSSKELTPGKPAPRHTSHADFCKALSASFARRSEAEQIRDATTGAVGLAQLLIEPWFRARCAEFVAYPFGHDDEDDEEEGDKTTDSVCLGLAGDGCTLEHSHDSSIQDALFADKDEEEEETEEEAARREAAAVLSELALSLARWPSTLWYAEHAQTVDALVHDVVSMCVSEAARGMQGRLAWGIALEDERHQHQHHRARTISGSGSFRSRVDSVSLRSERRGREDTRAGERDRSPFSTPGSAKHVRLASEDYSPSPPPSRKSSLKESPYKPRARSPLGASPILGPAIVIRPKSKKPEQKTEQEQEQEQPWSPSTPPPSPPLNHSLSEGDLRSATTPPKRRSPPPPPPPPPRSGRRPQSPTRSFSASPALPSPNTSPSSSLLKRSIHRRAESIPGSWPGGEGDSTPPEDRPGSPVSRQQAERPRKGEEEEGDLFWDPSVRVREQARRRPLSWAGSGMVLGAGAAASSSPSSSAESLLRAGGVHGSQAPSSPSPSPSSKKRGSSHVQSDTVQAREGLLTEVVSSALGLGSASGVAIAAAAAAAGANAASELVRSGSPLRLDTSSSAGSASASAESTGGAAAERERERPHASGPGPGSGARHRRHSSHGMPVELELSPVREVEQDDDEVEVEGEGKENGKENEKGKGKEKELGEGVESVEERRAVGIVRTLESESEPPVQEQFLKEPPVETSTLERPELTDSEARSAPEAQTQQTVPHSTGTGTTTPRSERRRSRSSTLELIPEEDWADWSIVDVPSFSEYPVERQERVVREETVESEIPLPPSPALELSERDAAVEAAGRVPEITLSVDEGVHASVEVGREGAAAAVSAAVAEGEDEDENVVDASHLSLSPPISVVPEATSSVLSNSNSNSTALVDSRVYIFPLFTLSLRDQLVKTRAFLSTFFVLPVSGILSKLPVPALPLPAAPSLSPMPSPIFEDIDTVGRAGGSGSGAGKVYERLTRFFSLFRIPFIHQHPESAGERSFFRRWRRGDSNSNSNLSTSGSGRSMSTILAPPPRWDAPILDSETSNALTTTGTRTGTGTGTGTTMMPDTDGAYWDAREASWVVSCFVCGVTAALVLAAVQEHRCETHMLVGNRYH